MVTAYFLLMFPASSVGGIFFGASAMERSFPTYAACMHEARTNPDISFTNAGQPDPSISVGIVCVKGLLKKGR